MKVYKIIIYILAYASLSSCYCPRDMIRQNGECAYRITCIGKIRGFQLPNKCLESTNYPVSIQVTLDDALDIFEENDNVEFLRTITILKIRGTWQETNLSLLKNTDKLQYLNLAGMGMERITTSYPFFYLNYLEDLNLSYNKLNNIENLFVFETHPSKLNRLTLSHNRINNIPAEAFGHLTSLVDLDLSYNLITDLTEEPFSNLTKLLVLRLNNNRIQDLNGALNNLINLKHLYLRGNEIQNIDDESLQIIEHLETFDVAGNQLEKIKPIMFVRHWDHLGNNSICKIILSDNDIETIPNGTAREMNLRYKSNPDTHAVEILTEIDISGNAISNIEYNAFQSLIGIEDLDLSRNQITVFIVNAEDLINVKFLNLSSNQIAELYFESFHLMRHLQNLDLSNNSLDYIPDMTFDNIYNLKVVNMTYNDIARLESIHINIFHPDGGVLDLSHNGLYKLRVPYGEGIRLVTLVLHSNNISDSSFIELRQQADLKYLDMSENLITDLNISSLSLPENLEHLNMRHNNIQRIGPSTFYKLRHLKTLLLGKNFITELEYGTFQGLALLQNLDLSYNKITFLDSNLLMDLKSLQYMSLKSNEMMGLDYKTWYNHVYDLQVSVDNNNLTCEWLAKALNDYRNGFSKMKPTVLLTVDSHHSVEGIPCDPVGKKSGAYIDAGSEYDVMADDRLLMTSQKILEAVRQQNCFLMKLVDRLEKSKKES